jgi:hypothetical protein
MRVIVSATPQHGHLLPLLPLARALRDRGNEVAVLTAGGMQPVVEPEGLRLLAAGPMADALIAEVIARTGTDAAHNPTPEAVAEFFAGARVDLTADEALAAARAFRPDLVIRELCDYIGLLIAAAQDTPSGCGGHRQGNRVHARGSRSRRPPGRRATHAQSPKTRRHHSHR